MRKLQMLLFATILTSAIVLVCSAPALAHDPFDPPANSNNGTGTTVTGGGGPFNPSGAQGSSSASNGSSSSSSSNASNSGSNSSTGSQSSNGSQGSNQGSSGSNANGSSNGAGNLPFTGHDPKPWFVIAYGLIALGGSAIAFTKLSVV
ncbi:MAG: hypothetical protein ABR579_05190 [Actinomycetota bacterium]